MKSYGKKQKKTGVITWIVAEAFLIFVISTASIVLYDVYINIDVQEYEIPKLEDTTKEVSTENTNDISGILEKASQSVVGISKITTNNTGIFSLNSVQTLSLGSGIIVSDNGYILTNEHVSGGKYSKCYVNIAGENKEYTGNVIWADSDIDLSIIKIEKIGLNVANLGDSDNIKIRK